MAGRGSGSLEMVRQLSVGLNIRALLLPRLELGKIARDYGFTQQTILLSF